MVVAAVAGRSVVKLRLWRICVFDIILSSSFYLFCFVLALYFLYWIGLLIPSF